jgi:hypothetical protein
VELLRLLLSFAPKTQQSTSVAACAQQIHGSGLLQLLPQMLVYCAEQLPVATAKSSCGDSTSSSTTSTSSAGTSSSSAQCHDGSCARGTPGDSNGQQLTQQLSKLQACSDCVSLYDMLTRYWPEDAFVCEVALDCVEPVLQAALAVFQCVSNTAGQLDVQQASSLLPELLACWDSATEALTTLLSAFEQFESKKRPWQPQLDQPVLRSPSLLPCATLYMAISTHALLQLQRQDPTLVTSARSVAEENFGASRSSSTPRSGSSSNGGSSHNSGSGSRTGSITSTSSTATSSSPANTKADQQSQRLSSDGSKVHQAAAEMLTKMPASHSKLFALLGCDSKSLMLVAAAKAEQLRAGGAKRVVFDQLGLVAAGGVWGWLAQHMGVRGQFSLHPQKQREQLVAFLVPAVLLHFTAEQATRPAQEQYNDWQVLILAASRVICLARGEYTCTGSYQPVPADLQQVVLQDLLPMVVQTSLAVLSLPGPAAYTGSDSGIAEGSSPANSPVDVHARPDFENATAAVCLAQCVCFAAHAPHDSRGLSVQAAALGPHVLIVGQLFETAARRAAHSGGLNRANFQALCRFLGTMCCVTNAGPGALLAAAVDAAAAEAACVSAEHARRQLAGFCCSILKAGSIVAAVSGNLQPMDKTYHIVASALTAVTASLSAGFQGEPTAAMLVPWLAITGRVLLYMPQQQADTAAVAPPAVRTADAAVGACEGGEAHSKADGGVPEADVVAPAVCVAVCNLDEMPQPHELLAVCVRLCRNLRVLLWADAVSQQLQAAGYDVKGLQHQLDAFLQLLPDNVTSMSLNSEQSAALQSLGSALTCVAFPCACNNPACSTLAGPLELQLVNGRSCMCAGCRVAHYCCRDCQRRHWKQHKPVCQAIAAAQASAAATHSAAAEARI